MKQIVIMYKFYYALTFASLILYAEQRFIDLQQQSTSTNKAMVIIAIFLWPLERYQIRAK